MVMMYKANMYSVTRKDGSTVLTTILFDEGVGGYRFVNITRNHICPCIFKTEKEALEDLEQKQKEGSVLHYELIA
jgi:hypothetical protein